MTTINLPFPPTVNTYYTVARGRKILSKKGRQYKALAYGLMAEAGHLGVKIQGELHVIISLTPPDKRRRDIDNYCKALLDAITDSGVWGDDSQIKRLSIEMLKPEAPGGAVVSITQTK